MCVRLLSWREKGFGVLKSTMTTILTTNMKRWFSFFLLHSFFFFLFAPFSIKGHLVVFANEEQLERNGFQSLEIDDDNSPKLIYGNILSRRVSDLNSCF